MRGLGAFREKFGRKTSSKLPITKFHRSKQLVLMRVLMDRFADDGKLSQGFTSADDLVEIDIGSGDKPRPTFISAK